MKAVIGISSAFLLLGAAAPGEQQFDLICTAKKETVRYRVDLAAKRYCAGDCKAVRPIVEVSATELVLERHEPAFRTDITSRTIINRSTGGWQTYVDIPGTGVPFAREGNCEPAPYSGLPTPKF